MVKADGLAAGKGVVVAATETEALAAIARKVGSTISDMVRRAISEVITGAGV